MIGSCSDYHSFIANAFAVIVIVWGIIIVVLAAKILLQGRRLRINQENLLREMNEFKKKGN